MHAASSGSHAASGSESLLCTHYEDLGLATGSLGECGRGDDQCQRTAVADLDSDSECSCSVVVALPVWPQPGRPGRLGRARGRTRGPADPRIKLTGRQRRRRRACHRSVWPGHKRGCRAAAARARDSHWHWQAAPPALRLLAWPGLTETHPVWPDIGVTVGRPELKVVETKEKDRAQCAAAPLFRRLARRVH